MFSKEEIIEIIRQKIQQDEKLGEQSGGSEHLGHIEFKLNHFISEQLSEDKLKIKYHYTLVVETGFTYYPDNPPMEYPHQKMIIVDRNKKITEEKDLQLKEDNTNTGDDFNWELAKGEIMDYLERLLLKIEWLYGENRAPFLYPPIFESFINEKGTNEYKCTIELDLAGKGNMVFQSDNPATLLKEIESEIQQRFLSAE